MQIQRKCSEKEKRDKGHTKDQSYNAYYKRLNSSF